MPRWPSARSTPTGSPSCWPRGRPRWPPRCSRWMPAAGRAATPNVPRAAASTTPRPGTRPASRSWPAGATPGSPSSASSATRGLPQSMPTGCRPVRTSAGTAAQVRALTARLPRRAVVPLFVFDAGYDPIALTVDLADLPVAILARIRCDRVFYTAPAPAPGRLGRPPRHGARFVCADPASWPAPDQTLQTDDEQYGRVRVACWGGLHPKRAGRGRWSDCAPPPIVTGTVIRVEVEHLPRPTARAVKTLWLWWAGPGRPDLDRCWRAYIRRLDLEHTFRFCKQALGWTTRGCARPSRLTAGPGWCSSPTPSSVWGAPSPPTRGCPGNGPCRRTG